MYYYPQRKFEFKLNSVWTDLTSYATGEISGDWGMAGRSPTDRVAGTGNLSFQLANRGGEFSPNSLTPMSGFKKGIEFRLSVEVENIWYVRWKGYVNAIDIDSDPYGQKTVNIKCVDWINHAATYPITFATTEVNKKANEGITDVLATLVVQPENTSLDTGTDTFATIFDTLKSNTKALSEFAKLTMSEFGFLYLKKDRVYGETLKFESRHSRDAGIAFDSIPVSKYDSTLLAQESGFQLLTESGEFIAIDEGTSVTFDNNFISCKLNYGEDVTNHVTVKTYPKYVNPSVEALYTLDKPLYIPASTTISNIRGTYTDSSGNKVSGSSLIQPVINTDYKFYANANATGTDLTANLVIVATLNNSDFIFDTITNTGGTAGYVTTLKIRGNAVSTFNTVEQFAKDDTSILDNGYLPTVIDRKYSSDNLQNNTLPNIVLNQEKTSKTRLESITCLANVSYDLMIAFVMFDIGSLIQVIDTPNNINGYYFINKIEFTMNTEGITYFTWTLREAVTLSEQYWTLGTVGYSELGVTTFVGY